MEAVARPTSDGGAVLLGRPLAAGAGLTAAQIRRALFGALIVLLVAATAGLLLARSVTRPLRQLTTAARRLTAGERAVTVGGAGPREVAEVGTALDASLVGSRRRRNGSAGSCWPSRTSCGPR